MGTQSRARAHHGQRQVANARRPTPRERWDRAGPLPGPGAALSALNTIFEQQRDGQRAWMLSGAGCLRVRFGRDSENSWRDHRVLQEQPSSLARSTGCRGQARDPTLLLRGAEANPLLTTPLLPALHTQMFLTWQEGERHKTRMCTDSILAGAGAGADRVRGHHFAPYTCSAAQTGTGYSRCVPVTSHRRA